MAESDTQPQPATVFVALCASGTKIQSLERVLAGLEMPSTAAVVLIFQHREALDVQGLRRTVAATGHDLQAIRDGTMAMAGGIYLPDANVILDVEDGRFRTRVAERAIGQRGTVDSFLVSLARDREGCVVAVALDGTEGDGTLGFKAVKEADGLTLAEDTDEARAGELAMSEHPAALADAVLSVAELPGRIASYVRHLAQRDAAPTAEPTASQADAARVAVADILRHGTGHDFHGYKTGTFLRRIERRMQVVEVEDIDGYVELLRTRPGEVQELFNDLLIGVTRFFRDAKEFERLAQDVIPGLFKGRGRADQVRVWVIGCSTGEEAYTLGILMREHMAQLVDVPQVQIFATDLDGRALAAARVGRYSSSIAADLGPERLARWFVREGNTFCVVKELRELCIFSQHSIVKDAPFSRLDLVSCRNLLIYLDAELQARTIPLFHFALRPGGTLFLGSSENVSRHTRLFTPIDVQSHIFRRVETGTRVLPDFPFSAGSALASANLPATIAPRVTELAMTRRAERVAERYAPAYVIVDEGYNVLHFSGRTGRYIDPSGGMASLNLLQLAHRDLRLDLRAVLVRAASEEQPVRVEGVRLGQNSDGRLIDIVVEALHEGTPRSSSFVVLFKDAGSIRTEGSGASVANQSVHTQRLEAELRSTQDRLRATNEVLETTNEELKASNEEYQALNEELQSMNEELQTSKEELQSVNEELTTLNGELGHRVRELSRANSDLQNLMESPQIPTLFLDQELRVTSYTPAAVELFHLVESDKGRPIGHIKARAVYDELQDDARRVLRTLAIAEREVHDDSGGLYMARVLPYRSTDNYIAGVVVTFVEVTELKRAERTLREQEERFRAFVAAASTTMYRMSPDWSEMQELDGRGILVNSASPSAKWIAEAILPEDQPQVLSAVQEAIRTKSTFALEHRVQRSNGSVGWTSLRAVPLLNEDGTIREWFSAAIDVTEQRRPIGAVAN